MNKWALALATTALTLTAMTASAAGDANKGKTVYTVCATCHGVQAEGNQALNAPALTGLQDWYIKRQLNNFKAGIRGANPQDTYGMQMRPMAMTLPDEQTIDDVIAYIKTLGQ